MLRVIRRLNERAEIEVVPTFLGAHAVPPEYEGDAEAYAAIVMNEMLPRAAGEKLAEYCDVFCERGYFDIEIARRILNEAKRHGLRLRMHVDQLTNSGGAMLAAEVGATTADHLEQTEERWHRGLEISERPASSAAGFGLRPRQDALPASARYD